MHAHAIEDPARFALAARDFTEELESPGDQRQFLECLITEVGTRKKQPEIEQVVYLLQRELRWIEE